MKKFLMCAAFVAAMAMFGTVNAQDAKKAPKAQKPATEQCTKKCDKKDAKCCKTDAKCAKKDAKCCKKNCKPTCNKANAKCPKDNKCKKDAPKVVK